MKNTNLAHPWMDESGSVSSGWIVWNLILMRIPVPMQSRLTALPVVSIAKVKLLASLAGLLVVALSPFARIHGRSRRLTHPFLYRNELMFSLRP